MADLKNIVMGLLTILFIATASVTMFSLGLVNNISSGGSGTSVPFPLQNQTEVFSGQMETYSQQLSNSTLSTATQPDAANAFAGLLATGQAASAAISLSFSSLTILLTMVSSMGVSLIPLGIPSVVFGFAALMLVVVVTFAILTAIFKWSI